MTIQMHVQCKLRHTNGGQQVVWLPQENARKGNYVRIKENGKWTDGWLVVEAYTLSPMPSEVIQERGRDFKNHRKATDI